ncbi:MAG TPA: hypothetical protein VLL76_04065 [Candidatus Omnitrophota bacterium]|nr:hypothetical protein [Candidatus Omnitrophota bacterium]
MMLTRRTLLALAACTLAAGRAQAAEEKKEIMQAVAVAIEYWDRDGLFHLVNADLLIVLDKEGMKVAKPAVEKITKTLSSLPWEEFNRGNPAVTIKNIALDSTRTDPVAGKHVSDVLISKLMIR